MDGVDRFQRRHSVLGFPIGVLYKFFDDAGGYMAALLTYYAFVCVFPLLLLIATILSVVLRNNPGLQKEILESALSQVPVVGDQLGDPQSLSGGTTGVVLGAVVAIYGVLGVGNALQYAMNTIWAVPRNSRPNLFLTRARSLLIVPLGLVVVIATTVLTSINAAADFGRATKWLVLALTVLVNTIVVYFIYRIGVGAADRRHLVAGSIAAAVLIQLLQLYGVAYVGGVVRNASATNGVFGFVLGLLAFIYILALILVVCAEVNAVAAKRLFPRALLTPFTDDVSLTEADIRQYGSQARATRTKGYQRIEVVFDDREGRPNGSDGDGRVPRRVDEQPGAVGQGGDGHGHEQDAPRASGPASPPARVDGRAE